MTAAPPSRLTAMASGRAEEAAAAAAAAEEEEEEAAAAAAARLAATLRQRLRGWEAALAAAQRLLVWERPLHSLVTAAALSGALW